MQCPSKASLAAVAVVTSERGKKVTNAELTRTIIIITLHEYEAQKEPPMITKTTYTKNKI